MKAIRCLVIAAVIIGCASLVIGKASPVPKRDINAVLRDHDRELLSIPNVTGVYVGATKENEPCLKVMLRQKPAKKDPAIPKQIEGYPVVTEVTGEIRPLK